MEEWEWKAGFPNFLSIAFSKKTNQIFLVLYDDKSEAATTGWGSEVFMTKKFLSLILIRKSLPVLIVTSSYISFIGNAYMAEGSVESAELSS